MRPANIVKIGKHRINWDNVTNVNTCAIWDGDDEGHSGVIVNFIGSKELTLEGDDALDMMSWLDSKEIPF